MSLLRKLALVALVWWSAGLQSALGAHNDPQDVAAIRDVLDAYRQAIHDKDKAAFVGLFFSDNPEHVTWQMVDDDARVARLKTFVPEARRVVWWPDNNHLAMIDRTVAADSGEIEVVFRDAVIDTDGEIASVNFDYSMSHDGEEQHWGREMWHLVRTDDGWRIISVIWSQRDPVSAP